MGIVVELRNQRGEVLGRAGEHASNSGAGYLPDFDSKEFPLLRYIDPYGTTVFNEGQMQDLLPELRLLRQRAEKAETERVIDGIIELTTKGTETPHLFLWWIGD